MEHVEIKLIGAIRISLLYNIGVRWVNMGHGGMTVIGSIRISLLYSVAVRWVSMGHVEMTLIDTISKNLLCSVGVRWMNIGFIVMTLIGAMSKSLLCSFCLPWVCMGHVGMTLICVIRNGLRKRAAVSLSSPQVPQRMSRFVLHLNDLLFENFATKWREKLRLKIFLLLRKNNIFFVFFL